MIVNRVGDVGLALGIGVVFYTFKTVDYATVFALVPLATTTKIPFLGLNVDVLTVISLCLF